MCQSDYISSAIRAWKVFAIKGRHCSAFVIEAADSRVEEAHSQMEMDSVRSKAASFASQVRG
jgi:hypothetical protein